MHYPVNCLALDMSSIRRYVLHCGSILGQIYGLIVWLFFTWGSDCSDCMENGSCELLKHNVKQLIGKCWRISINEFIVVFGHSLIRVLKRGIW